MEVIAQGPAETTTYFIAGFLVIFGVMFLYLMSLVIRWRKQQMDLQVLEEIEEEKA